MQSLYPTPDMPNFVLLCVESHEIHSHPPCFTDKKALAGKLRNSKKVKKLLNDKANKIGTQRVKLRVQNHFIFGGGGRFFCVSSAILELVL